MSDFEIEFLRTFYETFINIITHAKIKNALENFQTNINEQNRLRYSGRQAFGLMSWELHNAEKFTAAFAEALAKTSEKFIDKDADNIYKITKKIRTEYIPEIIKKLDPQNPFLELSKQLKFNLEQLPKKENTSIFNEYSFFGGAAIMVLGAAVIYNNYSPRQ